jgi:hypothetical protein
MTRLVGRIAHEIGHWLGMDDIYEDKLDTGEIVPGTAQAFCLSGSHDAEPLFAGREIHDTMHVLDASAPAIRRCARGRRPRRWMRRSRSVAHHGVENIRRKSASRAQAHRL